MEKPFRLADGRELPVGSCIAFAAMAIQRDPDKFAEPLKFDGFRSARGDATNYSDSFQRYRNASAISRTNLTYGI